MSIDDPKCPYCHVELDYVYTEHGVEVYACPDCGTHFYDDNGEMCLYEPMSDDDFELADFCHGGDLTED